MPRPELILIITTIRARVTPESLFTAAGDQSRYNEHAFVSAPVYPRPSGVIIAYRPWTFYGS